MKATLLILASLFVFAFTWLAFALILTLTGIGWWIGAIGLGGHVNLITSGVALGCAVLFFCLCNGVSIITLIVQLFLMTVSFVAAVLTMIRVNGAIATQMSGSQFLSLLEGYHLRVPCRAPCGNDTGYSFLSQSAPFQIIGIIGLFSLFYMSLICLEHLISRSDTNKGVVSLSGKLIIVLCLAFISIGTVWH